ncbi:MAG: class I SAM-dependent methyltransferase [Patescibacteria group bacterium]
MGMKRAQEMAERIGGWLTLNEGRFLYKLARNCAGAGVIVEIGSWMGRSTTWLGCGSKEGQSVPIYAVDPHEGGDEHHWAGPQKTLSLFAENMRAAQLDGIVHALVMTSRQAADLIDQPVTLLFIDGDHRYDYVRLDFDLWSPRLVKGGCIVLHDAWGATALPGPHRIVEECICPNLDFDQISTVDSIVAARRRTAP